jgi:hypothetical protein
MPLLEVAMYLLRIWNPLYPTSYFRRKGTLGTRGKVEISHRYLRQVGGKAFFQMKVFK